MINGSEAGGGTIRIHDPAIQQQVFSLLGIDEKSAEERFGFLLRALQYGAPPHGGIALGIDRWVMLFGGLDNIRDCIAFPKTQRASDLMTGAPGTVEAEAAERAGNQAGSLDARRDAYDNRAVHWKLTVVCVVMTALVLPGCASQPTESVSDAAVTSSSRQAASGDRQMPPQPMEEAVREPSDGSSAPMQANETPATPVEARQPQQNPVDNCADEHGRELGRRSIGPMRTAGRRCRRCVLSKRHEALCNVKVGDTMPAIELPSSWRRSNAKLAELLGKKATVVVFWKGDRRMAHRAAGRPRAGCDRAVWQSGRRGGRNRRE